MKGQLDVKSLVVGVVLGAVFMFSIGATQKSAESGFGRYKMLMNDKKVYILDSVTGKPWCADIDLGPQNSSTFWKAKQ